MDEQNVVELLQRYRRDRQVLLNYILSGNLVKKVVMPPGAISLDDVDIDQVSVDYVLNCAKKGEPLDLGDAIRLFHDSLDYPYVNNTGAVEEFYLLTKPEYSGPAPTREPPPVPATAPSPIVIPPPVAESSPSVSSPVAATSLAKSQSFDSPTEKELTIDDIEDFEDEEDEFDSRRASRRHQTDASDLSLRLPQFETGITDDDLRETAYEILVAAAGASGGLIVPQKEKKKERRSKLMRKLGRSKSESAESHTHRQPGLVGLLETMRAQLEITESMDIRTRQGLLNAMAGKIGKRMDSLLIPLELLCCISRAEFSDMKAYLRWQKRQLNILEEGLINHPVAGFGDLGRKVNELRNLFRKIEESESLPPSAAEVQRTECLRSLREVATSLSERPARGDLTGEVCHWADGYHLNIALYEKMLGGVFDILDEGKLTEEVEEILELLKSTWRILGITETVHDTCYAWVLFRQFACTGEQGLLKVVIDHLRKIPLKEQRGPQERIHLKSLRSSVDAEGSYQDFTFFQSFLSPIQKWVDKKLNDYHIHLSEGAPSMMADIVTVAMLTRRILGEENEKAMESPDRDQIDRYISSSVKNAFLKMAHSVEFKADTTHEHVLASLAVETKNLLKKDTTVFTPILSKWHPQAAVVSASLIHKLYGNKLRPYLEHAEHLTEDVVSVFPAADALEQYIMSVMASVVGDDGLDSICRQKLAPYQIENKSGTLVLRWVNGQLERIETWVKRAADQEVWDPISPQQRHGSSIVEVYRIIEETTDQFFAFKIPMRDGELNSLCRGLDKAFQAYTQLVTAPIVDKEDIVPPVPVLTRYKKELGIKAFVKKEVQEIKTVDERKASEITQLTMPKLCVRLNSLYYGISQLSKLEDSINERWARKKTENNKIRRTTSEKSKSVISNQKVQFDGTRKEINTAIDRLCEFTGTKVIFWDLQQPFIDNLYKNSVSQARLDTIMEVLDLVLNQLCDVIVEQLRDRVVTGLLQASLDGLLRVILDGGSTRVFSPNDAPLLEDDLETLKEFFISGGDGLPRGTVENLVTRVRPVINLIKQETRVLIDDLREVTQGGKSKFGTDSKTLLRVLCHRNDSEASHYVKKQFKIPSSAPTT
ncbi:hypothetical protein ACP4OV_011645 [Aristida adscensionis]